MVDRSSSLCKRLPGRVTCQHLEMTNRRSPGADLQPAAGSGEQCHSYPLVNVQKTMENYHF